MNAPTPFSPRRRALDLLRSTTSLLSVEVPEITLEDGSVAVFYLRQPTVADVVEFAEAKATIDAADPNDTDGAKNAKNTARMLETVARLMVEEDGTPAGITVDDLTSLPTPVSMRLAGAFVGIINEGNAIIGGDAPSTVKKVSPQRRNAPISAVPPLTVGDSGNDSSGTQGNT